LGFGGDQGYRLHPGVTSPLLPTFHPLCMFTIVFRDISYLKQSSLFCLLWLISACADRIGFITNISVA